MACLGGEVEDGQCDGRAEWYPAVRDRVRLDAGPPSECGPGAGVVGDADGQAGRVVLVKETLAQRRLGGRAEAAAGGADAVGGEGECALKLACPVGSEGDVYAVQLVLDRVIDR